MNLMFENLLDSPLTEIDSSDISVADGRLPAPDSSVPPHKFESALLYRMLESSLDCIKLLDLQGRLLYMNSNGQVIMEVDDFASQLKLKHWLPFWQGEAHDAASIAFETASQGGTGRFDGYCSTAKGTPKWWEVVVTPVTDEDGQVVQILSVSRDITERKQMELALRKRNQALDAFTHTVSHDLKAPLRGIASLSEWLSEELADYPSDDIQSYLTLMRERAVRMQALVDGLLQVSRVGTENIQSEAIELETLVAEIVDSLAPSEQFQVNCAAPLPKFYAKKILLNQVFANLISNAIKHHHQTSGQIDISAVEQGDCFEFAIADDGPGIAAKDREKVFEIFKTLSPSSNSTQNTGIGLALVKKIVESEGGRLWIDEETETGSKFCFTWPKRSL